MRIPGKCILSLAIAGLLAVPAPAQKIAPGVLNGVFAGKLFLLQGEDIQKDLKMSDEQVAKIKDLFEKRRNAYKDLPTDKDERTKKIQEIQKESQEREKQAGDTLKPEQMKRLDQILLQQQGANALINPRVIDELKITDEQKTKVREAIQESGKELRDLFQRGKVNLEDMQKKMAEFRTRSMEKAAAVLTPEQQKQWKEMVGEPFKGKVGFSGGPIRPPLIPPVKPSDK